MPGAEIEEVGLGWSNWCCKSWRDLKALPMDKHNPGVGYFSHSPSFFNEFFSTGRADYDGMGAAPELRGVMETQRRGCEGTSSLFVCLYQSSICMVLARTMAPGLLYALRKNLID